MLRLRSFLVALSLLGGVLIAVPGCGGGSEQVPLADVPPVPPPPTNDASANAPPGSSPAVLPD